MSSTRSRLSYNSPSLLLALCLATLLTGCGPSVQHQKSEEALKRLQKIDAATTVGVTYLQYRQLLVDAQEAVNAMERSDKPAPGRENVNAAMQTYADAAALWEREVSRDGILSTCNDELSPLITKYQLDLFEAYKGCSLAKSLKVAMAYQVWPVAKRQIDGAAKQIQADQDTFTRVKAAIPGLR